VIDYANLTNEICMLALLVHRSMARSNAKALPDHILYNLKEKKMKAKIQDEKIVGVNDYVWLITKIDGVEALTMTRTIMLMG